MRCRPGLKGALTGRAGRLYKDLQTAQRDAGRWVCRKTGKLLRQTIGCPEVIGIQKGNVFAPSFPEQAVARVAAGS